MEPFRIYFNRRKQWLEIYVEDVSPETFKLKGGGRWGYFLPKWEKSRKGFFGEVHLVRSRIRPDLVVHEMFHVVCEWLRARYVNLTARNEEDMAELLDELVRKFYKEHHKKG